MSLVSRIKKAIPINMREVQVSLEGARVIITGENWDRTLISTEVPIYGPLKVGQLEFAINKLTPHYERSGRKIVLFE